MTHKPVHVYPGPDELTVVIRSAGERTERLCAGVLRQRLPDSGQLHVLHEVPFSAAVRRTFEIGIQSNRPWLIAIDADIIPLDDVVVRMREICGKMASEAFVATPLFLCKSVGGLATRGLHCYRTSLLEEAYKLIGKCPASHRPESCIHDAMVSRGYTRECYAKIFGLHEYEQSYIHIYLKAMLRYRKDEFREQIRTSLKRRAAHDADCEVALWGFEDARRDVEHGVQLPDGYDWAGEYPRFTQRMRDKGWDEKPALARRASKSCVLDHIRCHDYQSDTQSLAWIRELLEFARGAPDAIAYVNATPCLESRASSMPSPARG